MGSVPLIWKILKSLLLKIIGKTFGFLDIFLSAQGDCPPVHLILLVILDKEVKNSPRLLVE